MINSKYDRFERKLEENIDSSHPENCGVYTARFQIFRKIYVQLIKTYRMFHHDAFEVIWNKDIFWIMQCNSAENYICNTEIKKNNIIDDDGCLATTIKRD